MSKYSTVISVVALVVGAAVLCYALYNDSQVKRAAFTAGYIQAQGWVK